MFRKFIFTVSLSVALCAPAVSQAAVLSDSINQALLSHPQMKASEAAHAQAEKNVWEQAASFYPTVSLNGTAGRLHNDDDTTRANTADGGAAAAWMGQGTVTLTQPVFTGFGNLNRYHGAQERSSAAEYDLSSRAEEVALRAARAHLNLMRSRDLLALSSQFLSDIEARQKNIALMVKEGAADEAELLQANEIQASAKNTRLGYEESFRRAEADYIEVVGGSPDASLEFGEMTWNDLIPAAMEDAVSRAVSANPRVLAANKISSALTRETDAEKASLLPRLDADVSYMKKDQGDTVGGEAISAQAMLRLGWNFSLGGGQIARIGKSREQQKEAAARRQDMIRNIEREVRQKYTAMEIVDRQLELLIERESASKKILDNFVSQFEAGKQTNLQLIAANAKMFEAQASRTDAFYRRLLSRFELLNAMGVLRGAFGAVKTKVGQKG